MPNSTVMISLQLVSSIPRAQRPMRRRLCDDSGIDAYTRGKLQCSTEYFSFVNFNVLTKLSSTLTLEVQLNCSTEFSTDLPTLASARDFLFADHTGMSVGNTDDIVCGATRSIFPAYLP